MTDTPIRTPAEALEAAAQACLRRKEFDGPPLDHPFDKGYLAACDACVKDIRALASRIAAPDDEALVEMLSNHPNIQKRWDRGDSLDAVMGVTLAALREAGALRHEQ